MEPIRAVGAMSGTSLDGVDAAEIWTDGETIARFGASSYRAYSETERSVIRAALGRWPGEPTVAEAAEVVETAHARLLAPYAQADLVGFHGQTLAHDPDARRTHQAGDGGVLAQVLGRPVVWDFRTADVALGGQGAPLAPAFHHACARWIGAQAPLAFLNLGGVGNLTWVDPAKTDMAEDRALLAFDTGPANAPINDLCMDWLGQPFDRDGALALEGEVHPGLVAELLRHPYFYKMPPKSLDRDAFRTAGAAIDALPPSHAAATWVAVIAASVRHGLTQMPQPPDRLLVTGGGRLNPAILDALTAALPCPVRPVEDVGLDGDMLEAQAFAYLAVRVRRGLPTSFPDTTGVSAQVGGGQVSLPDGMVDRLSTVARQDPRRRVRHAQQDR
ncbi:anhydro-N-acetylmuramic acid kinase [Jannaschia pagri]|uniref:Anhydro-N-acetylmuramic acid kinase n=1 Tax=Jannaschia pagri TaxID=2829797 RepID=A0ABQ4NPN6_9RHOB|nr:MULTISPECIES: anhydro-N-acetylmuramic acid kinase [unclassified Jannaschia]GIT92359.1 anhydro-N-acetylmuramic acid kinase [Jannaschia sp. AI_61]GIT96194.1 anhydro-N-acetylmuramic acid kinase [Jannaschia sp. AI_62]